MPTKITPFRFEEDVLERADRLATHLTIARSGNTLQKVSRAEAVRTAVTDAYEQASAKIEAENAAWTQLVERRGPLATIAFQLVGRGEPEPSPEHEFFDRGRRIRVPGQARWTEYDVVATLDGEPVNDLPLRLEPEGPSLVVVCLTDPTGEVRIPLGTLSTAVTDPDTYSVRLTSIGRSFGLPYPQSSGTGA